MQNKLKFYNQIFLAFLLFSCSPPPEIPADSQAIQLCFEAPCFRGLLVQLIDSSKSLIQTALYGFTDEEILQALIRALERGVSLEVLSDYDSEVQSGFQELIRLKVSRQLEDSRLKIVFGNAAGIMHNKYWIFDGETVVTGSTNLTSGMETHFNHLIGIRSQKLAEFFQSDFQRMKSGAFASVKDDSGEIPRWISEEDLIGDLRIQAFFTPYKNYYPPVYFDDPETPLEDPLELNYSNALGAEILPLVEGARKSVWVFAYSLTDRILIHRLKQAALRGVQVRVWMDRGQYFSSSSYAGDRIQDLARASGFLKLTKNPEGLLHHKVLIIDEETVVLGSLNFSAAAVSDNDENFLILRNAFSAAGAMRKEASRIDMVSDDLVAP